jgi:hypothetical protein
MTGLRFEMTDALRPTIPNAGERAAIEDERHEDGRGAGRRSVFRAALTRWDGDRADRRELR